MCLDIKYIKRGAENWVRFVISFIYDFSISATSICRVSAYFDMVFLLSIVFLYFIERITLFMTRSGVVNLFP